jgi:hypothetical protein
VSKRKEEEEEEEKKEAEGKLAEPCREQGWRRSAAHPGL